ncbi:hypothetical protein LCGC14_1805520 [marine sediment metagenome]|uniref:Uncharacterized protein n=1 Tax=marine sediment metagenome TaxID=412755 RepID=A0A0F9J336_9ZZZZ
MIIVCPNNPDHKRFNVTAHVSEEWIVDEEGTFIDVAQGSSGGEILHKPDLEDYYVCLECITEAKVTK